MITAVRSEVSVNEPVLYLAFELAKKQWKLAMTSGFGVAAIVRTVSSGDWQAIEGALAGARHRFGLPAATAVVSCYEAGRDGFWIHRALVARAIANRVVDSSSIDVKRRPRRMKTDRIDALKLVHMLVRACAGEADVWSEVRVPPLAVEAARHGSRERTALTQEQTRLVNQLRSGLATMGAALPKQRPDGWWTTVRDWGGRAAAGAAAAAIRAGTGPPAACRRPDRHTRERAAANGGDRAGAERGRPLGAIERHCGDQRDGAHR
jgi:transposase